MQKFENSQKSDNEINKIHRIRDLNPLIRDLNPPIRNVTSFSRFFKNFHSFDLRGIATKKPLSVT